ncbi:MAG: OB-fold domain-containing protein [bacterium]|nr:OB-fold domain-containing protein [bacterium]
MGVKSEAIADWRRKNKYLLKVEAGVLVSVTRVHKPPRLFAKYAPYWMGIIDLKRGRKIMGRGVGQVVTVEGQKPKIGDRVTATRRILYADGDNGVIHYGIKWVVQK